MDQFEVRARLKVRDGKLEEFKQQAAEMMRVTREKNTGTLAYDWFLSEDGTTCEVREAYVDADALVEHALNVREAREAMFAQFAYDHGCVLRRTVAPARRAGEQGRGGRHLVHPVPGLSACECLLILAGGCPLPPSGLLDEECSVSIRRPSVAEIGKGGITVNESQVSPTAQYADEVLHLESEPESPAIMPPRPEIAAQPSNWSAHRVAALVTGTLLALVGVVFLGAGGTGLWADLTQREAGYATTDEHRFSTAGSALATERTELGSAGTSWLYAPGLLGKIRIRITPASPDQELFVGIGPSAEVDRYLAGANHTVITDFWSEKMRPGAATRPHPHPERRSSGWPLPPAPGL